MKKLTILVDYDDVVVDFLPTWLSALNQEYGCNVKIKDVASWGISSLFPFLTPEQMETPLYYDEFWARVPLKQGAHSCLIKLKNDGHKVFIVTAAPYATIFSKINQSLLRHFDFLSFDDVIITSQKQMIRGDVLVDDSAANLIGGGYEKILMDMPHNQTFREEHFNVTRVKTWSEIYNKICSIASEKSDTTTESISEPEVDPIETFAMKKEVSSPILYTTGCPKCNVLKEKLKSKNITFDEVTSKEEMLKLGISHVPLLKVEEEMLAFVEANRWINEQ